VLVAIAGPAPTGVAAPSPVALADIPPDALDAYQQAGLAWNVDWAILAAIGKVECDHGRATLPGCLPDTVNPAGARGYLQILGSTWRHTLGDHQLEPRTTPPAPDGTGVATDGNGDGHADPWSWPDATASAARDLTAAGIQTDVAAALHAYNHDDRYVAQVLTIAASYRATDQPDDASVDPSASVPLASVDGITVNVQLAERLDALIHAAAADGLTLGGAGYRSRDEQVALRRAHCGTSDDAIYRMPPDQCRPATALPGTSMHERGLAVDFTCNALQVTAGDVCWRWLTVHAASFGLDNLPAEPWHWSTTGT